WRTHFDANPAVAGRTVTINGLLYTIVGVMPETFDPLLLKSDLWIPTAFSAEKLRDHDNHYLSVLGRLRPGVSLPQVRAELDGIAAREQQLYPIDDKGRGFQASDLTQTLLGDQHLALIMML